MRTIAACLLLIAGLPVASANFLSYVDDKGTRHIVTSEGDVPEKYRATLKSSSAGDPENATRGPGTGTGYDQSLADVQAGNLYGASDGSESSSYSSASSGSTSGSAAAVVTAPPPRRTTITPVRLPSKSSGGGATYRK